MDTSGFFFEIIKMIFAEFPTLGFPFLSKPLIFKCDSSQMAIYTTIIQFENDNEINIAFGSHKFSNSEMNYANKDKEMLVCLGLQNVSSIATREMVRVNSDHHT